MPARWRSATPAPGGCEGNPPSTEILRVGATGVKDIPLCVQIGVSHPILDHVKVITRLEQVHCRGVAYRVWADFLGLDGGTRLPCFGRIFTDDGADAETGDRLAVSVEKHRGSLRCGRLPVLEVVLQSLNGIRPEGAGPFLSSLAKELYLVRHFEAQLVDS